MPSDPETERARAAWQAVFQALERSDPAALEEAWLEAAEAAPGNPEGIAKVIEKLTGEGRSGELVALLELLADSLRTHDSPASRLQVLQELARLGSKRETLREELLKTCRLCYGEHPEREEILRASGMTGGRDLVEAIEGAELLFSFREGDPLLHRGQWGLGRITRIDVAERTLVVDFETRKGHRVPLSLVPSNFQRIAPDDFRWMKVWNRKALEELADRDPAALVDKAVAALGEGITVRELREELAGSPACLAGSIFPRELWSRWWQRARTAIEKAGALELTDERQPRIVRARSADEQSQEQLREVRQRKTLEERISFLWDQRDWLRTFPAARDLLAEALEQGATREGLAARLLLEDLGQDTEGLTEAGLREALGAGALRELLLSHFPIGLRVRALDRLDSLGLLEQTASLLETLLADGDDELRRLASRKLLELGRPRKLEDLFHEIRSSPGRHPAQFLWALRFSRELGRLEACSSWSPREKLQGLIEVLDRLGEAQLRSGKASLLAGTPDTRAILQTARQALSAKSFSPLREALDSLDPAGGGVREILSSVRRNRGMSEPAKADVIAILERRFPELVAKQPAAEEPIYVTSEGLRRRNEEYVHLFQEEIPAISRQIGEALAFGDVSDNAELRAARERQAFLIERVRAMEQELIRARLIDPAGIPADRVGIGSRVDLVDVETSERLQYTLLGPWDSDPDKGLISYLSPVGNCLLGKGRGEIAEVKLQNAVKRYRVEQIAPGLLANSGTSGP